VLLFSGAPAELASCSREHECRTGRGAGKLKRGLGQSLSILDPRGTGEKWIGAEKKFGGRWKRQGHQLGVWT
jgi:hypothetical protein